MQAGDLPYWVRCGWSACCGSSSPTIFTKSRSPGGHAALSSTLLIVSLSFSFLYLPRKRMLCEQVVTVLFASFVRSVPARWRSFYLLLPSMPYIAFSRVDFSLSLCSLSLALRYVSPFGLNSSTYVHERIDASVRGDGLRGNKTLARSASLAKLPPWQLARTCMVALLGFGLLTNIFAHYVFGITWHRCLSLLALLVSHVFLSLLTFRCSALAGKS